MLDLPAATLLELGHALRQGTLRHGVTAGLLAPFAGSRAGDMAMVMRELTEAGCSPDVLGRMCHVLHTAKSRSDTAEASVFPVLSGPDVPGTPVVSTPMMVRALFEEAQRDVIVASYVFVESREILAPLAAKMDADPSFRVRVIVDLSHRKQHAQEPLPIVANRFKSGFFREQWPGSRHPELWHDPRVFLTNERKNTGVMHAKAVIIDDSAALITSANFTEAAQNRNIEAGIMLRGHPAIARLRGYFDGMIKSGILRPVA